MNKDEIKREYASLVSEIYEQVTYLQEIGVAHADVVLPIEPSGGKMDTVNPVKKVSQDMLKKLVPSERVAGPEHMRQETNSKSKPRRRNLASSQLSRLKVESKPRKINQNFEETKSPVNTMPKEPKLKDSVIIDISEALPESNETLESVWNDIGADCERCRLCEKRTQVVHSKGNPNADLMFIGEAPGADEDEQGAPFVGRAGKLLTKIIEAIDLTREDVFIGNINRCRPPGNRQPQADEVEMCKPFLLREIAVVRPKVIVVMGNTACQNLLGTKVGITKLRGSFKDYFGVKVMPTFHPAYLLRDPRKKREVWEDMKTVRTYLDNSR